MTVLQHMPTLVSLCLKDSFHLSSVAILSSPYMIWVVFALSFHTDDLSHSFIFRYLLKNNTKFDESIENKEWEEQIKKAEEVRRYG